MADRLPGKVIGMDLSVTAPGFAVAYNGDVGADTLKVPDKMRGAERMDLIVTAARTWAAGAGLVVIEGMAPHGFDDGEQLAGLRWIVRLAMHRAGTPVAIAPPASVKQYATGNGAAGKPAMVAAAQAMWPDVEFVTDDAADAAFLAAMGARYLGRPCDDHARVHPAAMEGVTWHDDPRTDAQRRAAKKAAAAAKPGRARKAATTKEIKR